MANQQDNSGLTGLGKFVSFVMIAGLISLGAYVFLKRNAARTQISGNTGNDSSATVSSGNNTSSSPDVRTAAVANTEPPKKLAETQFSVPRLPAPQAYVMKNNLVEIELAEYAGYAGLIAANGGLEPNDNSIFAKKHGFRVKFTLSEEESWPALNSGRMAGSATTADVLAVYGRQFAVTVPAQIGFSRGADGIVVRSDVRKINDLRGKTLATGQFTEADFFIRYLAQEAGLGVNLLADWNATPDPDKVNLIFCEDAVVAGDVFLENLKSGDSKLAGCVTWAPKTTEVAQDSGGKAYVLTTNKNLLIVADVFILNRGFAEQNPKIVAGLVDGLLEGNRMVRDNPDAQLDVIGKAFKWDRAKTKAELAKVHLSNLPENLAFFSGAIDMAGSFGGIYQSAVLAYGNALVKDPIDAEKFESLDALKLAEASGAFKDQVVAIQPIRSNAVGSTLEQNPLLSKDIRFYFQPNDFKLDMSNGENDKLLEQVQSLLAVSPGSTLLLRGHVDNARVEDFRKQGGENYVRTMALKAMELSKNRAAEVKRILIETKKVDPKRIDTVGRGWEEPSGTDPDKNRRVEVQWFTLE